MNEVDLSLFEAEELKLAAERSGKNLSDYVSAIFCPGGDMHLERAADESANRFSCPEGDMHLVAIVTPETK